MRLDAIAKDEVHFVGSARMDELPKKVDWREKGAVTPVKNQGQCGSCWAFSATGSLEGRYFVKNHELKSFSEQQLVDCTRSYGNYGCAGGMVDNSEDYWEDTKAEVETGYPYEGKDDSCFDDWDKGVAHVSNYHYIKQYSVEGLMTALQSGPVSVHVEADKPVFSQYSGGVLDSKDCGTNLDHAVLAVGYDVDGGYWIVKNSWGDQWGENGYLRIAMEGNICGITSMMLYPDI